MDWSNVMAALGQGARPGSALMAGVQQPQPQYTQQPVAPMSQPMYSNALASPTSGMGDGQAVAATQAGATPPPMPQQQGHGVFSNLVKMFAGG